MYTNVHSNAVSYQLQLFPGLSIKMNFFSIKRDSLLQLTAIFPRRDRQALTRQVDKLDNTDKLQGHLKRIPLQGRIGRVFLRGNQNSTVDNFHCVIHEDEPVISVIIDDAVHEWEIPQEVFDQWITTGKTTKKTRSMFNQTIKTIEHEWGDARFDEGDYNG